jgi:orotidine-5'-phosphate decarboxylase
MNNTIKSEFILKLEKLWKQGKFVCVGLDPEVSKIPQFLKDSFNNDVEEVIFEFNKNIIDKTADLVLAYKPNSAFYEGEGKDGIKALMRTIDYIKTNFPDIPVILDCKRADIGNTNEAYAKAAFDLMKADAITVHPYLGKEALMPFLKRKDKGVVVLVKTSNPGSGEFQDLVIDETNEQLSERVAFNIAQNWNENGNCAIVVGATYPKDLAKIRKIVGDMPILIPGIGAQGGDLEATVKAGVDNRGFGVIINSARGIIFASDKDDYADVARQKTIELNDAISALM